MSGTEAISNEARWMRDALEQAQRCAPSPTAYRVGCLIVDQSGRTASGYSRATGRTEHAEEVAIADAIAQGLDLSRATLYVTMEPCGLRASKPECCADLIARLGIPRVVFATREPTTFSTVSGADRLAEGGTEVVHLVEFAEQALTIATATE